MKLVFQLKQVLSQRYGGQVFMACFQFSFDHQFHLRGHLQHHMDLKGSRKRWTAGHEPADSVESPSTSPLGSEPGVSLAVHDSGQDLGGYKQLSSASSSETVQYIPQTHV